MLTAQCFAGGIQRPVVLLFQAIDLVNHMSLHLLQDILQILKEFSKRYQNIPRFGDHATALGQHSLAVVVEPVIHPFDLFPISKAVAFLDAQFSANGPVGRIDPFSSQVFHGLGVL